MAVVPGEAWMDKAAAVADSDQLLTIGDVERTLRVVSMTLTCRLSSDQPLLENSAS